MSFSLSVPVSFWFLTSVCGPAQERLLVPQFLTEGGGLASELRSWPHRPRSSVWELGFSSGSSGCVSNSWSPQSFPKLFICACHNLRPIERVSIAFCRSPAQKRIRTALGSKRRRGFRRPQVPGPTLTPHGLRGLQLPALRSYNSHGLQCGGAAVGVGQPEGLGSQPVGCSLLA